MTFVWFLIWFAADHLGGRAPLRFDPANAWVWTLILAVALDLGGSHAQGRSRHGR